MADASTLAAALSAAAPAAAGAAGGAQGVAQPTPTPLNVIGPDGKLSVARLRAAYPMYANLTDDQLLIGVHQKLYPDVSPRQFYGAVNYDTDAAKANPTNDMGGGARFLAGMGKTASDVIDSTKRIGNAVGIGDYDQQAAQADQDIARPLMNTAGGQFGKLTGDVMATAVPMAKGGQVLTRALGALPGAAGATGAALAPYIAAAGTGAGAGAMLSPANMTGGAEVGAAMGPAGQLAGNLGGAVWSGAKAAVEPLWDAGRQRVLARTLNRFASDPSTLQGAAANPQILVPGYTPTLAEATGDTGLAQLQRGASSAMPGVATAMSDANVQRMQAYRAALDDLAGNDGKADYYAAARKANAETNYGAAYGTPLQMTPELQASFDNLMQRPSVQAAQGPAQNLALEKGLTLDNPAGSVMGLDYINKALGDQASAAMQNGNTALGKAVGDTQDEFLDTLRQASPQYGEAIDQYKADSAPLNQMAIGQKLRDTMIPALADFNPDLARSRAQQYAQALRDSANTARGATGQDTATIENTLTPEQLATVNGVGTDAARYATAQDAGRVPGSPTAQYLGAQNIMRQTLGPLGLPQGLADTELGRQAAGVLSIPFRTTQGRTEEMLARVLRDPAFAAQIAATRDAAPLPATIMQTMTAPVAVSSKTNN